MILGPDRVAGSVGEFDLGGYTQVDERRLAAVELLYPSDSIGITLLRPPARLIDLGAGLGKPGAGDDPAHNHGAYVPASQLSAACVSVSVRARRATPKIGRQGL